MPRAISIVTQPPQTIYGLCMQSSDKGIAKDIPALSKRYYEAINAAPGSILPFVVLSRGYEPSMGQFELFIGGYQENSGLVPVELPGGFYGKLSVRPKLGLLWGLAVGEAKRYFYTKWLSASGYKALNMEYEYHTEKSTGKKPEIDLLFAIEKAGN